ncbi:MAG: glycosyltransferase family 2 protein [Thermodesulfobacteriota bacterium]
MIVIPMAGLSSRFFRAGYQVPKYMLPARGRSVFRWAVESFARYFGQERFLFVLRDVAGTLDFACAECRAMGLGRAVFVTLDAPTRGQADTVRLGLELSGAEPCEPLTVFNIDTFRPGFRHPEWLEQGVSYLEVFTGPGEGWSFAEPDPARPGYVLRTAEKQRISDLCSNGLYHFSRTALFLDAVARQAALPPGELLAGELYVAPLYNELIAAGHQVRYRQVGQDEVVFCGVPEEYEAFCAQPGSAPGKEAA